MQKFFSTNNKPRHIAVIMDGNGRWAKARGFARHKGHEEGALRALELVKNCLEFEIPYLTLYVFSTENWQRPAAEIAILQEILQRHLDKCEQFLRDNQIKLLVVGDMTRFSNNLQKQVQEVQLLSSSSEKMVLTLALSYSSREEIADAARQIAEKVMRAELSCEQITTTLFQQHLSTYPSPDPDLIIRTSGEKRLSNFLLWQSAYAELYLCDVLWPDFLQKHLLQAIEFYKTRQRRFGGGIR